MFRGRDIMLMVMSILTPMGNMMGGYIRLLCCANYAMILFDFWFSLEVQVQLNLLDLLGPFRFWLTTLRTGRVVPLFKPLSLRVLDEKAGENRVIAQIEQGLPS